MPIYEYACPTCGVYELTQRITEPARTSCEKCGKPVQRLVSASSFSLKGGGWYSDLYSGSGKSSSSSSEKKSSGPDKAA